MRPETDSQLSTVTSVASQGLLLLTADDWPSDQRIPPKNKAGRIVRSWLNWNPFGKLSNHAARSLSRNLAERWPSGLRRRFAKPLYGQKLYPGFESLPLRQFLPPQVFNFNRKCLAVAQETAPGSDVCGATVMSYLYGPDGRRVAKVNNGQIVKQFYYDAAGQEIAETNAAGALQRAEIFAGGRHLATWTNSGGGATYFNHADWLGTERARSNSAGTLCETITSLPFGDGQATTPQNGGCATADPSPNHFTGKERDAESGLDFFGARYMSAVQGRFTSTDPIYFQKEMLVDPQRWNLYAYGRNNPLRFIDPKR